MSKAELRSPTFIEWQLPGHQYTMTIHRLDSLKKWIRANKAHILDYQILELAPHHRKSVPRIVREGLEGKKKRRKVPSISPTELAQTDLGFEWTQVIKANEWENLIYLNKLHLFDSDISLCKRVDLDTMPFFFDAYPEDPTEKNTCKFCAWAFIREYRK